MRVVKTVCVTGCAENLMTICNLFNAHPSQDASSSAPFSAILTQQLLLLLCASCGRRSSVLVGDDSYTYVRRGIWEAIRHNVE